MVNSRNKGHSYERLIARELNKRFPDCLTSRNGSGKLTDDAGIDIIDTGCFNIQTKCYTSFGGNKMLETLKNMPKDTNFNMLLVKIKNKGELVCFDKEDWYEMLEVLKGNGII